MFGTKLASPFAIRTWLLRIPTPDASLVSSAFAFTGWAGSKVRFAFATLRIAHFVLLSVCDITFAEKLGFWAFDLQLRYHVRLLSDYARDTIPK